MARDALEAFRARLAEPQRHRASVPFPIYFNFLHGIELSLKSYMVHTGSTLRDMHCVGHDLEAAMDICIQRGLRDSCPNLTDVMIATIRNANELYHRKDFEYIRVGYIQLVHIDDVEMTAAALLVYLNGIEMRRTSPEWASRLEESLDQGSA